MRLWRKRFLIAGTILFVATIVLFILFVINSSVSPFNSEVFCFIPVLLELLSTACFVAYAASRPSEAHNIRSWRKKFLVSGIILFASTIVFLKLFIANSLDFPLIKELACFIPITLELLSTACFIVYTVTRPDTENLFPRTTAVIFIGGMLAFSWYVIWYVN